MVDIRQLRYFVAVAEKLHFGVAAESLHVTQPPLSRQIAALEKELGVLLFERNSRQVHLTTAGKRFLIDSKALLANFDQACLNAQLTQAGEMGSIKLGFMMHAAYSSVPILTKRFLSAYPKIKLHLEESLPFTLVDDLLNGKFDAVITFNQELSPRVSSVVIHQEPLCLVVPKEHKLAGQTVVAPASLVDQDLIIAPREVVPTLYSAIQHYFQKAGVGFPNIRLEAQLQQTIVNLVSEGLGVAIVPRSLERLGVDNIRFCELENAPQVDHILAWRAGHLNPALDRLRDLL